jgi:hypothetical protein
MAELLAAEQVSTERIPLNGAFHPLAKPPTLYDGVARRSAARAAVSRPRLPFVRAR